MDLNLFVKPYSTKKRTPAMAARLTKTDYPTALALRNCLRYMSELDENKNNMFIMDNLNLLNVAIQVKNHVDLGKNPPAGELFAKIYKEFTKDKL